MRELLQIMMRHKHVRQKPLLIVANKQDLSDSLDLVDITYYFHIDEIANLLGTPSFIATCGHSNHSDLFIGIEWLVGYIVANFHVLTNRIRFNRSILSPVVKLKRQMTSRPRKVSMLMTKLSGIRQKKIPSSFNFRRVLMSDCVFDRLHWLSTLSAIDIMVWEIISRWHQCNWFIQQRLRQRISSDRNREESNNWRWLNCQHRPNSRSNRNQTCQCISQTLYQFNINNQIFNEWYLYVQL